MRAVRWVSSLSPKSLSPKFLSGAGSPWRCSSGSRSPPPEQGATQEQEPAELPEVPPLVRRLLAQVQAEAEREGLEAARYIFRESGFEAAVSLPRGHFLVALRAIAERCEVGRRYSQREAEEILHAVFLRVSRDGAYVLFDDLQATLELIELQESGASRDAVAAELGIHSHGSATSADGGKETPLRSLNDAQTGATVRVLSDPTTVVNACRQAAIHAGYESAWLASAGKTAQVVHADPADDTVKCRVESLGDVWFALSALAYAEAEPLGRGQPGRAEDSADYAVFRPLTEDIQRHGMSVWRAFDVLREGRPGISEQGLRQIMDCYFVNDPPEARRRACARAWALARTDLAGEIDFAEFERLVARARAATAGAPAGAAQVGELSPGSGALDAAAAPAGGRHGRLGKDEGMGGRPAAHPLRVGDMVSAHVLVHGRKSTKPTTARVEGFTRDAVDVLAGGVRQRIPRAWVEGSGEAVEEAESSEAPSSANADASSRAAESRDLSTGWNPTAAGSCTTPGGPGLVGLENLGNSCYMNAILQCLAGTADLVRYFLGSGGVERDLNPDNCLGSGGNVAREFAAVLGNLWGSEQSGGACRPSRFKAAVAKSSDQFSGAEQQDSQEFASYLLDCLHEDLNRVRGRKPAVEFPDLTREVLGQKGEERAAAECWSLYLKRDKSIIVDIFQGQLRSQIRCLCCGYLSTKFDSFMYLSLPVVDSAGAPLSSLGECLREFAREERLSGEERWFCPQCKDHVDATKALVLWKLPTVLLVHLKRFRFENGSAGGGTGGSSSWYSGNWCNRSPRWSQGAQKLSHKVDFSLEGVDMGGLGALSPNSPQKAGNEAAKSEPIFDAFALVDHFGSCGYGHYTAIVWHGAAGRWHRFDDEGVAAIDVDEVLSDKAYLLFLRRRGDVVRPQTRSNPEAWPHRVNRAWSFLKGEEPGRTGRVYL